MRRGFYVFLGIVCSILTIAFMPMLIRKSAGKLYKKKLKVKRHTDTTEEEV